MMAGKARGELKERLFGMLSLKKSDKGRHEAKQ